MQEEGNGIGSLGVTPHVVDAKPRATSTLRYAHRARSRWTSDRKTASAVEQRGLCRAGHTDNADGRFRRRLEGNIAERLALVAVAERDISETEGTRGPFERTQSALSKMSGDSSSPANARSALWPSKTGVGRPSCSSLPSARRTRDVHVRTIKSSPSVRMPRQTCFTTMSSTVADPSARVIPNQHIEPASMKATGRWPGTPLLECRTKRLCSKSSPPIALTFRNAPSTSWTLRSFPVS